MKYLFSHWKKLSLKIKDFQRVYLFLDYDGTLTPVVSRPEDARLSASVKKILKKLNSYPGLSIAIISGRSLKDTKKLVSIRGLVYAGNHGLEIEQGNRKIKRSITLSSRPLLENIRSSLEDKLKGIKGVIVEDKGLTLSVHFRMARLEHRARIKSIFKKILRPHTASQRLKVTSGKMVLEVRPAVEWHKGMAVLAILGRGKALPIYIGDDVTDTDAFRALKGKGVSIFVGKPEKNIKADYYLKDTKEVARFLGQLLSLCRK
ncbi:MAG: trehalose-phosphatase [Candidatus Omnitrophica bacterium]|nr:trehalose-phosphatase [Candidatus Omnitrophota bacterium]